MHLDIGFRSAQVGCSFKNEDMRIPTLPPGITWRIFDYGL